MGVDFHGRDDRFTYDDEGNQSGYSASYRYELARRDEQEVKGAGDGLPNIGGCLGVGVVLCVVALKVLEFLHGLPPLVWVAVLAIAILLGVAATIWSVYRFRQRPFASLSVLTLVVCSSWFVIWLMSPVSGGGPDDPVNPEQRATLKMTTKGSVVVYRFDAFPNAWSAPIVIPQDFDRFDASSSDFAHIEVSVDGKVINPTHFSAHEGMSVRFRSTSGKRLSTEVRIVMLKKRG